MSESVEPFGAATEGRGPDTVRWPDVGWSPPGEDGELAALVRGWMSSGGGREAQGPRTTTPAASQRPGTGPQPDASVHTLQPTRARTEQEGRPLRRTLPQRLTGTPLEPAMRVAVLVDARAVSAEAATALLDRVLEEGTVAVCRAYADWKQPDLGDWVTRLRDHGLQSFHQVTGDEGDRAFLTMALDALEVVRDSAVDTVVLAGTLGAALPLVERLHASGVRVVAASSTHTPHDVRATCDEFVDLDALGSGCAVTAGRHRA